jgi:hypothetical protein
MDARWRRMSIPLRTVLVTDDGFIHFPKLNFPISSITYKYSGKVPIFITETFSVFCCYDIKDLMGVMNK